MFGGLREEEKGVWWGVGVWEKFLWYYKRGFKVPQIHTKIKVNYNNFLDALVSLEVGPVSESLIQ